MFHLENRPEKVAGWYQLPGKVDKSSYLLLVFFVLSLAGLWLFQTLI